MLNKKYIFFQKREQTQSHQKQINKQTKTTKQESKTGPVRGLVTV
jgi:hypothetical protein